MKFSCVVFSQGTPESGVNKKINSQIKFLNEYGIDADVIVIAYDTRNPANPRLNKKSILPDTVRNLGTRIKNARKIAGIIGNHIRTLGTSDVLYIRYPILMVYFPVIFFRPFRKCRVIFEYNTLVNYELLLTHYYFALFLEYILGFFIQLNADAGIGVTDEITDTQRRKFWNRGKPFITIANGIEVDPVSIRTPPLLNHRNFTMICVANVSQWHGLDRLIRGIAEYAGKYSVTLHIVGEGMDIRNLKTLCHQKHMDDHVIFHGFLSGAALDTLFNQSHVAVGSLGIHRKGLTQTSELKAREYCARGIPYIIACSDPDFPLDFPYISRLPADESPVDVEGVIRFATAVCQDRDHPQKMRQFAVDHLAWSVKIRKLKNFLEDLTPGIRTL